MNEQRSLIESERLRRFATEIDRVQRQSAADDINFEVDPSGATIELTYDFDTDPIGSPMDALIKSGLLTDPSAGDNDD